MLQVSRSGEEMPCFSLVLALALIQILGKFCSSGLAKATPVTGQPSGVREVHVDSPAVRGADRGRAMQLHGVPEVNHPCRSQ